MTNKKKPKHQELQEKHQMLLSLLSELDITDLLELYIEAKTGEYTSIDDLPVYIIEAIDGLGYELNKIYMDKVIKDLFKK